MNKAILIKIIKGTDYVTLNAHNEAISDVEWSAKREESGYGSFLYRAKVIVSDRDSEGDLQEKSSVERTFKNLKLAVHWTRNIMLSREGDGDLVTGVLYELKERRINDDGSPRYTPGSLFGIPRWS